VRSRPGHVLCASTQRLTAQCHISSAIRSGRISCWGLPEERVDLQGLCIQPSWNATWRCSNTAWILSSAARGVKLSGGQAQRTAAARMLVRDAELLVFDDLSSALDVEMNASCGAPLCERSTAVSLSRIAAASVQRADHILVLKDGRVEAEGTLAELLETCEESLQRLWRGEWEVRESEE